jgi:hypothetical protein
LLKQFLGVLMKRLPIEDIHLRHQVFTENTANSSLEAASVCFDQYHQSPAEFQIQDGEEFEMVEIHWQSPDEGTQRAWGDNKTKRTIEDGACICAIAAVELRRDLFASQHADEGSGIDYIVLPSRVYLAPSGAKDLEKAWGLEVSGTIGDKSVVRSRLRKKMIQSSAGNHSLPSIACVVGFKVKLILMKTIQAGVLFDGNDVIIDQLT